MTIDADNISAVTGLDSKNNLFDIANNEAIRQLKLVMHSEIFPVDFKLFTSAGRLVMNILIYEKTSVMDVSVFTAGIYFARAGNSESEELKKIIIY